MSRPVKRHPARKQVSAGGVAFRSGPDQTQIVIVLTAAGGKWQLPKGMIDPGETEVEAAIREVREEGGVETDAIGELGQTEYTFTASFNGARCIIHKSVHWFLLKYLSGDVNDHDHEVQEARWVSADEALEFLKFENEREIVRKAMFLIAEMSGSDR
ncbi:MAG: NUDIX hydrolase [Pyrinomonadaceae bacterium]